MGKKTTRASHDTTQSLQESCDLEFLLQFIVRTFPPLLSRSTRAAARGPLSHTQHDPKHSLPLNPQNPATGCEGRKENTEEFRLLKKKIERIFQNTRIHAAKRVWRWRSFVLKNPPTGEVERRWGSSSGAARDPAGLRNDRQSWKILHPSTTSLPLRGTKHP